MGRPRSAAAAGTIAIGHDDVVCVAPAALREGPAAVEAELEGFTTSLAAWAEAQVPALAGARIDELARELALRTLR
ncbi:hypothetical protein [Nannocystis radixulma]|uniref:Uncharacterized protein n=1 Tax=Nannocystis radixulma TaxID=2995305 RepID=A0ABT5BNX6_9BACT|nr:hypothetical protein [Nannocystis radixulma]MDC0675807.1 hypothetical protein [Nannocystis radixulma]